LSNRQKIFDELTTCQNNEKQMTIGIIDADLIDNGTRHPNLALMKISGYCKEYGHDAKLLMDYNDLERFDHVFVSKVFSFTKHDPRIESLEHISCGGTGFFSDGGESLPKNVEHHMPDYSLYDDYVNKVLKNGGKESRVSDYRYYSIGFLTRGCFRKCDFCVNKKYDNVFDHSPVKEFLDESRPYIYLWDDNFLGSRNWKKLLKTLNDTGKPFQFRQGLDIRLMTDAKAEALANSRYYGDFIFAFDHIHESEQIKKRLKIWRNHTNRGTRLYVLCAYESIDANDIENIFKRIEILMKCACLPYIMRYENYKESEWKSLYTNLARWCNQPHIFKKMSYRQFCERNQHYHKNKVTDCAALRSMKEFELKYPDIATKYFDLRYEDLREY
jgi:hypothetical protein